MGALLGLMFGVGVLMIWRSGSRRGVSNRTTTRSVNERVAELLAQAGYPSVRPQQLLIVCASCSVVMFLVAAGVSRAAGIGLAFAAFAGYAPVALVKMRRRQRTVELREVWPDVVDNLASAVRAGMSLPEGLAGLAERGPAELRPAFARFAASYRASGRLGECLDALELDLADPVGDRVCETMRMAHEVGGSDVGSVLRTLSELLRSDARTRAELETRQGWIVNAARLAVAAPWAVLLLLGTRSTTLSAYDSGGGALLLVIGAAVCLLAYRLMLRIGRLPDEPRVLSR